MKLKEPKNKNYCATVVEIKMLVPLANCDNVVHAIIMGNSVVVSKETKIGDIGLFFPVETALSDAYLKANNLYRKGEMNEDPTQKGYFEENGRIRCVKFRQNKSEGLFMPWQSLKFTNFVKSDWTKIEGLIGTPLNIGDEFDELEGIEICHKYISPKQTRSSDHVKHQNGKGFKKYETKLVDGQFRFHEDTSMLYKNLHRFSGDSLISVTYKLHGTSGISSYVLCKKPVPFYTKALVGIWNFFQSFFIPGDHSMEMEDTQYDYLYSSRKVIKNAELNPGAQHYYDVDIWGLAHDKVKDFLHKGMTFYYEIVGYTPSGSSIQGEFDYGQDPGTFGIYIYRITSTNIDGKVIEFSAKQVQDFCKGNGLKAVPELYYGYARDFVDNFELLMNTNNFGSNKLYCRTNTEFNSDEFLARMKREFNEKKCYMCKNNVIEEGCVVRIESTVFDAYKCKSFGFLEMESKNLDKNKTNLEDDQ